jgi:protein O-mannosyl-transferase
MFRAYSYVSLYLRSGLRVLPNNAKLHYNYANFLRDTSNLNLAKQHYRKALMLWPNYASAWNNLGTLIEDDIDTQEQHFLAAIRFSDQHINAHFNLGQLYR